MSEELPRLLYTPAEVAEMFGTSRSTIMTLRISEKWPYTKLGGRYMFSPEDIKEIVSRGSRTPEPTRTTRTRRTRR